MTTEIYRQFPLCAHFKQTRGIMKEVEEIYDRDMQVYKMETTSLSKHNAGKEDKNHFHRIFSFFKR